MLQKPAPVIVKHRFPALLDALLEVLEGLSPAEWDLPTAAAGWSVKDVALHLLGDQAGILSGRRDDFHEPHPQISSWEELVPWINQRNALWVQATRRISPRLLCDLLSHVGGQVNEFFAGLDEAAPGKEVSWAGAGPAPTWLELAREFTEYWHHQQHIRDAVGKPGSTQPFFLAPVLEAFVFALPRTFRQVEAEEGTCVTLTITGEAGGEWSVVRESGAWQLYCGKPKKIDAQVTLPEDAAWRLFTKGIAREQARKRAGLSGDPALAEKMLETISIIA